jgi:sterol desaturase/sphingolipid hydroxylase (fatty acid hydroxylase superfamily)
MLRRIGLILAFGMLEAVVVIGVITHIRAGITLSATSLLQVGDGWWGVVGDWRYVAVLAALMAVEFAFPARRDLPKLRVGIAQDATWFVISTLLTLTVVSFVLTALDSGLSQLLRFWKPDLTHVLGTGAVAVLAFVLGDLCAWFSHWVHHRTPLWQFHAVHHSQTAMNVLSDNRQHVVETIVNASVVFIPARLLGLDAASAGLLAFAALAFSAFIHANIRTDLGPLRYVFISPQAHRVHHSIHAEHYDTNFGTVFACWDYIFGTRCPEREVYPPTGIADADFPMETSATPVALVKTWWEQTKYPFVTLVHPHRDALVTALAPYETHAQAA